MIKIVNGRPFWLNALVIIFLGFLSIFGVLKMLGVITKHGKVLNVPTVLSTNTIAAIELLESKGFEVVIQDSTFTDTAKLGTVLKQFPEGNSLVKINRTVLLTVNRVVLPSVEMPSLVGKSQEYAFEILERAHFKIGDTTFEPSYMQGAITAQSLNGAKLEPGAKIPWGSKIDLVIGLGLSDRQFQVPNLLGLTFTEAKALLLERRLILASANADADVTDSARAFVYVQYPPRENEDKSINYIREGQIMDLTLSKNMKFIVDSSSMGNNVIDESALLQMEKETAEINKLTEERERKEKAEKKRVLGNKYSAVRKKTTVPIVVKSAPKPFVPRALPKPLPKSAIKPVVKITPKPIIKTVPKTTQKVALKPAQKIAPRSSKKTIKK